MAHDGSRASAFLAGMHSRNLMQSQKRRSDSQRGALRARFNFSHCPVTALKLPGRYAPWDASALRTECSHSTKTLNSRASAGRTAHALTEPLRQ